MPCRCHADTIQIPCRCHTDAMQMPCSRRNLLIYHGWSDGLIICHHIMQSRSQISRVISPSTSSLEVGGVIAAMIAMITIIISATVTTLLLLFLLGREVHVTESTPLASFEVTTFTATTPPSQRKSLRSFREDSMQHSTAAATTWESPRVNSTPTPALPPMNHAAAPPHTIPPRRSPIDIMSDISDMSYTTFFFTCVTFWQFYDSVYSAVRPPSGPSRGAAPAGRAIEGHFLLMLGP